MYKANVRKREVILCSAHNQAYKMLVYNYMNITVNISINNLMQMQAEDIFS